MGGVDGLLLPMLAFASLMAVAGLAGLVVELRRNADNVTTLAGRTPRRRDAPLRAADVPDLHNADGVAAWLFDAAARGHRYYDGATQLSPRDHQVVRLVATALATAAAREGTRQGRWRLRRVGGL